ncbi:MAG: response regulator transcription factor [Deinococcota bacterium]
MANLLVVEDDKRLASLLERELTSAGHDVTVVFDGTSALVAADESGTPADLVVLDLNLPDMDGLEVARHLHADGEARILMLTARGDLESRLDGLYAGASDYLTKPFSVQELLARIYVQLRDTSQEACLELGPLSLDVKTGRCTVDGSPLILTQQEFKLLELLLSNRGRIFSKEDLESRLYGLQDMPDSNTVEVFISRLRKKLSKAGVVNAIRTVRNMGYVIP